MRIIVCNGNCINLPALCIYIIKLRLQYFNGFIFQNTMKIFRIIIFFNFIKNVIMRRPGMYRETIYVKIKINTTLTAIEYAYAIIIIK